ncbi:MAG: PAS domain-containing sensor histidine kinase [Arcobacteraceae bacterium]|nr:PAS domain-containing sensor histidine kinase [Arcobacteraceae bacterium]
MKDILNKRREYLEDFFSLVNKNLIYSRTDLKGIIIESSDLFCEISGYSRDELIGKPHNKVRHPDMSSDTFKNIWSTIKSGNSWKGEIENLSKEGKLYWVVANISPQYDKSGEICSYISVRRDITAEKQVKELNFALELNILEMANESMKVHHLNLTLEKRVKEEVERNHQKDQQLIYQSKFATMGEMISMIAHQWKQPLNVLSLNIASLEFMHCTKQYSKDELESIIKNTNSSIAYMSDTIQDFTNFLKPSNINNEVKIDTLFAQLKSLINTDIKKQQIDLDVKFNLNLDSKIRINISKFTQVMINIIKNSIDEFKIKDIENKYIKIYVTKDNINYNISIKDNAGGIPENILETIFEPYTSTKGKNGTGLGMYMSKLIVENHLHGTIEVSNDQYGAVFDIHIPISSNG